MISAIEKLWLENYQCYIAALERHGFDAHLDEVANNAELKAGWNPLMVKCVGRGAGWDFGWRFDLKVDAPDLAL